MDIEDEAYSEEDFHEEEIADEVEPEKRTKFVDPKTKTLSSKKEIEDEVEDDDYDEPGAFAEISVKDESEEEEKVQREITD